MDLESAVQKYRIAVPTDAEFYSQEYKDYFDPSVEPEYNERLEKFRPFQEMYYRSFVATFHEGMERNGLSDNDSRAVVLGGQTGAGKTGLSILAKMEFAERGQQLYIIDDDMYRHFYPRADEILKECPEHFTIISAMGSGPVTPKIMKYASDKGLNFLFDGTLKNPRIINTAMSWPNYKIDWMIMATSKKESLLSIFERNEELRQIKQARLITVDAHNETYIGLEPTLMQLENIPDVGRIRVFSRGENHGLPILQYDSTTKQGKYFSAYHALRAERAIDDKAHTESEVLARIDKLQNSSVPLNDNEREALFQLQEELLPNSRYNEQY